MPLNGHTRACARRMGGLTSLRLADVSDVVSVTHNPDGDAFVSVMLAEGVKWAEYRFAEGTAELYEHYSETDGACSVEHRLRFRLSGNRAALSAAVKELSASEGLLAAVVTAEGDAFLVGYSLSFGSERPLRLSAATVASAAASADTPYAEITLSSADDSFSKRFAGGA